MVYDLTNGVFVMSKGAPNKRYTPECKALVVKTMLNERLSYSETARQFGVVRSRITAWERIYLEEGAAGIPGGAARTRK